MNKIVSSLLVVFSLLFSTLTYARVEFGVGTSGASSGISDGSAASLTWIVEPSVTDDTWLEDKTEMPWVLGMSYHQKYITGDVPIDSHLKITAGKRVIDFQLYKELYFYADLGIAWTSKISDANSSFFMFYEQAGLRYEGFSLSVNHTSNAGLKGRNMGENTLLLSYRLF